MKYSRTSALVPISLLACVASQTAQADVITGTDGYVSSISGIVVNGTTYDVTMEYDKNFNDIFGAGDPPTTSVPTFYNDATGAEAARDAIATTLNAETSYNNAKTLYIMVPTRLRPGGAAPKDDPTLYFDYYRVYQNAGGGTWSGNYSLAASGYGSGRTQSYLTTSEFAFATFTPSGASPIPEPSTAITMGLLGIVGFAGNRRRRRQV